MLYDNAQLVSLYSEAFQKTKNSLYKEIVYETLGFIAREMTSPANGFYSALDADSEGEEGKYYVWKKEELQLLLKDDFALFADYFNINERGLWEHENYNLLRHETDDVIAAKHNISEDQLKTRITDYKKQLLAVREKRIKPGLDNKILTSWNALMIKGYTDAFNAFDEPRFLEAAIKGMEHLLKNSLHKANELSHLIAENAPDRALGFLEDYAFTIEALLALYETTFIEDYLHKANGLMVYTIDHFEDKHSGMFYFTSDLDKALITRKMELSDNVIPASNSALAKCLFLLGHHFENETYIEKSRKMLNNVVSEIENYGAGYSNWAMLLLNFSLPFHEVVIVGKSVDEKRKDLIKHYFPNRIFAGSASESSLPLFKNRFLENETLIYMCENKTCFAPVKNIEDALRQISG
ncbi:MAG: thioredoxin domain-containing protein [Bacteroidetes bacterium]|nr:thioredoxin domain-containing protein [Bacteroidota bacterium]